MGINGSSLRKSETTLGFEDSTQLRNAYFLARSETRPWQAEAFRKDAKNDNNFIASQISQRLNKHDNLQYNTFVSDKNIFKSTSTSKLNHNQHEDFKSFTNTNRRLKLQKLFRLIADRKSSNSGISPARDSPDSPPNVAKTLSVSTLLSYHD